MNARRSKEEGSKNRNPELNLYSPADGSREALPAIKKRIVLIIVVDVDGTSVSPQLMFDLECATAMQKWVLSQVGVSGTGSVAETHNEGEEFRQGGECKAAMCSR